jgi:hypothetical protein
VRALDELDLETIVGLAGQDPELSALLGRPQQAPPSAPPGKGPPVSSTPTSISVEERRAIEERAVFVVGQHLGEWPLTDVSTKERAVAALGKEYPGFDLVCDTSVERLTIEVKGTKRGDPVIRITSNELRHASDASARLAVVSGIRTHLNDEGWDAVGGDLAIYRWSGTEAVTALLTRIDEFAMTNGIQPSEPSWCLVVGSCPLLELDPISRPR